MAGYGREGLKARPFIAVVLQIAGELDRMMPIGRSRGASPSKILSSFAPGQSCPRFNLATNPERHGTGVEIIMMNLGIIITIRGIAMTRRRIVITIR